VNLADARRVLRPLFETTEVNLVSARQPSGLHPFDSPTGQPGEPVCPPPDFFLNVDLLGSANNVKGLNRVEARRFLGPRNDCRDAAFRLNAFAVAPDEYRALLEKAGQRLAGSPPTAPLPQDTHFAWFTPGPSFVDTHWVSPLIEDGAVTPQFAAAVLAVDLKQRVFSTARAGLLGLVPESYAYVPRPEAVDPFAAAHPDDLTRAVIAALEARAPAAGSPEAEFLELLRSPDPLARLGQGIAAYQDDVKSKLEDQGRRAGELERLFNELRSRRVRLRQDEVLGALAEFDGPLPE
jgi:hypothetical protein